jgi:O-antigen/teichoic acid export membrane protein
MLYFRTLLSVVVGLYTSRVVLSTLGVEDYGLYGLVGGIVSLLGFLNASLADATSRFITYDLGRGDAENLKQTFNSAFQSHLVIAFIVLFFGETIGLWIVNNLLDIPEGRSFAANAIFQLSILSSFIGITQVPYTSAVLAHEQMDVFAWLEILNVVLKLIIVWLLQLMTNDRLIFYGILVFAVALLIRTIYSFYCHRHYPESHLFFDWNPKKLCKMLSFTGWSLYYNASETIRLQGINIIINRFFGVVMNASCSLASMIQGVCWILGHNIVSAFRPQIIKQYAACNYLRMQQLMNQALKFTLVIICLFYVPAIFEMTYLIDIWLGYVPPYLVPFCRIYLLDTIVGLVIHIITIGIYAYGNIKAISIFSGTLKFFCLPVVFFLFYHSFSPTWAYWSNLFCLVFIVVFDFHILKLHIPQLRVSSLISTCANVFSIILVCAVGYYFLRQYLPGCFPFKLFSAVAFVSFSLLLSYLFLLDSTERRFFRLYLYEKFRG